MANRRYNTAYYKRTRLQVLERDYYTCHYCAQEATTVDHLIPISKGGTDEISNTVAACNPCNSAKKDRLEVPKITFRGGFFERIGTPTTPIGKIFPENGSARHYQE